MNRNPHKKRIEVLINIWSLLTKLKNTINRIDVIKILKSNYEKFKLEPLRGLAKPDDIYEKELSSLYVVGKYGLGLYDEFKDLFERIFRNEILYDELIKRLREVNEPTKVREMLTSLLGEINEINLVKLLRLPFTSTVLGFSSEEDFINLINKIKAALPEFEETIKRYIRFYVAFRTAEAIAKGIIRDRIGKEAFKQALCLKLGFPKVIPNDHYVYSIAKDVFKIPERILTKILKIEEGK